MVTRHLSSKMPRQLKKLLLLSTFLSVFLILVTVDYFSGDTPRRQIPISSIAYINRAVLESSKQTKLPTAVSRLPPPQSVAGVLLPDWEVLVLLPPSSGNHRRDDKSASLSCLFPDGAMSPASFSGVLPWTHRPTFKCTVPTSLRWRSVQGRRRKGGGLLVPVLVDPRVKMESGLLPGEKVLRWNFLVYESYSTTDDVVVFAKGVNNRQNSNRPPSDLLCVFRSGNFAVTTAVTSSVQEVFRCHHPEMSKLAIDPSEPITVSLQFDVNKMARKVPSVAEYHPLPPPVYDRETNSRSLLCACTMVNNVGKFLPEWITYHSAVGVDRFFFYDNGSDDDLDNVIDGLIINKGVNIITYQWPWVKTQEAGFSHCAVAHRQTCKWMMFLDVDEFAFSPNWRNSTEPSPGMLKSILPGDEDRVGQMMMSCQDYGPSGQARHPPDGVTQGYTCRRRLEERHKSIVKLDAVDDGLLNVVHHFNLSEGFEWRRMSSSQVVVNHYKYQAWSEFRAKFRRRVSAYVADWTQELNPGSKDRTPGLGFEPVEPEDWTERFCDVRDTRLKDVTRKWFGRVRFNGKHVMAWENRRGCRAPAWQWWWFFDCRSDCLRVCVAGVKAFAVVRRPWRRWRVRLRGICGGCGGDV